MKIEYSLLFVVIFFVDCSPVLENQRAVSLVLKDEHGNFKSNLDEVEKILLDPEIKNLRVAVVSIAGKYRRGKSFMLNYFLRYLNRKAVGNTGDWIGSGNDELTGFEWKVQPGRVTTGILIWSKIFVTEINNEKIAIVLMDTQGTFDDEHTVAEHTKIFAMVTLLSSFEIYNVQRDIEEDDLQVLATFTQYAEQIHNKSDFKIGQNLQFLVRDWSLPFEYPYGYEGGELNLMKKLNITKRNQEFVRVREALKSSYNHISCYLMPHPGLTVITNPDSKGRIAAMDKIFVKHLKEYVPSIFSEKNLKIKMFNGRKITVSDLFHYIKYYGKIFNEKDSSSFKDIFAYHVHGTFALAQKEAIQTYNYVMDKEIENLSKLNDSLVENVHKISCETAMNFLHKSYIKGSEDIYESYRTKLEKEISSSYEEFKKIIKLTREGKEREKIFHIMEVISGGLYHVMTTAVISVNPYMAIPIIAIEIAGAVGKATNQ